jgi:hypothetical protein
MKYYVLGTNREKLIRFSAVIVLSARDIVYSVLTFVYFFNQSSQSGIVQ